MSRMRKVEEFAIAVASLYLISRMVLPGRHTAAVIKAANANFSNMIKVVIAEHAVETRNVPRFEELLGEMDDEVMTELFAGLNETDLDWVESHLRIGEE